MTGHMRELFHPPTGPFSVKEVAEKAGATLLEGDEAFHLTDVATLQDAQEGFLSFFDNPKYKEALENTKASAVILREEHADMLPDGVIALKSETPYPAYARAAQMFHPVVEGHVGISDKAHIAPSVTLGAGVSVEAGAVIDENAVIGDSSHIGPNTHIGRHVMIGAHCVISGNVTITCTEMGDHCLVHPGARIGQDGFGFAFDGKEVVKVPQVGHVEIGENVEIGANCTIDRGALGPTRIGSHTKIDNLVQIGHNAKVGDMCQIVAQCAIAGSATIGNGVIIGGQAGVAGHLNVADGVMIAARAGVTKNVNTAKEVVGGFPAMPIRKWRKQQALLSRMLTEGKAAKKE